MTDTKKKKFHRNSKFNPMKTRNGEKIGGGWWVFRRGDDTGRVRVPVWPYEHGSHESACDEAIRLAKQYPGEMFVIVCVGGGVQATAEGKVMLFEDGKYQADLDENSRAAE